MPPKESPLAMTNVLRATSRVMLGCTVFVLGLGLVGCGSDGGNSGGDGGVAGDGGGTGQAPVFRNRVEMDDTALATAALDVINHAETGCAQCHGITRQTIRHWRALTDTAYENCVPESTHGVGTQAVAQGVLRCLRGGTDDGAFDAARLGVFAVAADLPWFRHVFQRAGGANATMAHQQFVSRVSMPPPNVGGYDQARFDLLAEWFLRGVPQLDAILPDDPRPETCTPGVSADVRRYTTGIAMTNWAVRNRERNLLMHGCNGATNPRQCLASAPRANTTTFGATWEHMPGATLRVLHSTDYQSSFWTRSSADGRFVSHGVRGSSPSVAFIDLQANRVITGAANYDPSFFPDNSGFAMHGMGAFVCEQSVLTMGNPMAVSFMESQCGRNGTIGLYEHVATSLDGADYWAVYGQFESDDGGRSPTLRDPRAPFAASSRTRFTLMASTGSGFTQRGTASVLTPYEGDAVNSPSGGLIVSRVAGANNGQLGYVLRRMDVQREGGLSVELPEIARYCITGGKPGFSFDERFMTIHHYVSPTSDADARELGFTGASDPGYAMYAQRGASNVYLVELATGRTTRVTHMGPGQYALFPHFRADGWLYFLVRTAGSRPEHVVASDALLVAESMQ